MRQDSIFKPRAIRIDYLGRKVLSVALAIVTAGALGVKCLKVGGPVIAASAGRLRFDCEVGALPLVAR